MSIDVITCDILAVDVTPPHLKRMIPFIANEDEDKTFIIMNVKTIQTDDHSPACTSLACNIREIDDLRWEKTSAIIYPEC